MPETAVPQRPPIRQADVYPLGREQWTGYRTGYVELPSGRVTFTTIAAGFEKAQGAILDAFQTNEAAAWKAFDLGLRDWLKDKPGIVLWRMEPSLQTEDERVVDEIAAFYRTREARVDSGNRAPLTEAEMLVTRKRYYVAARLAVTENREFTNAEAIEATYA